MRTARLGQASTRAVMHMSHRDVTSEGNAMPGETTRRGYDYKHKAARIRAIRRLQDGDPCTRCGGGMLRSEAKHLDLDHTDDRQGYRGLAHARCNRRAGAAKAVAIRTQQNPPKAVINSRVW